MGQVMGRRAWFAAALAGLGAVIAVVWQGKRVEPPPVSGPSVSVVLRNRSGPLPGNAARGAALFRIHCTSCHGRGGRGDGPAAEVLWPPPRDLADPYYMNRRSDRDLYDAIYGGGPAVNRSRLMPAWREVLDTLDIWDVVAYLRTLHPRLADALPGSWRAQYCDVRLAPERMEELRRACGKTVSDSWSPFFAIFREGEEAKLVAFSRVAVGGVDVWLTVVAAADGCLERAFTDREIRLPDGAGTECGGLSKAGGGRSLDPWLQQFRGPRPYEWRLEPVAGLEDACRRLADVLRETAWRVALAAEQRWKDEQEARALRARFAQAPDALPLGQRVFLQACAACHGTLGDGADVPAERDYLPRSLRDGKRMGRMSDEDLRSMIKYGGLYWNVSEVMPSLRSLSEEELEALVRHVRSLAVP